MGTINNPYLAKEVKRNIRTKLQYAKQQQPVIDERTKTFYEIINGRLKRRDKLDYESKQSNQIIKSLGITLDILKRKGYLR